ncbi:hypothetical protein HDE_12909 [Halotydeus destructor]|nr:hypothetical protein HDE_12909 [Halotydeus destructor]
MELNDAVAMLKKSFLAVIDHFAKLHECAEVLCSRKTGSCHCSASCNYKSAEIQAPLAGSCASLCETQVPCSPSNSIQLEPNTQPKAAASEESKIEGGKKLKKYATAFQAFSMLMRDKVRSEMSNPSSSKLSRHLKKRFGSLSAEEKLPFENMVDDENRSGASSQPSKKRRSNDDLNNGNSNPLDAVALFLDAETSATRASMPGATEEAIRMAMLRRWDNLPEDQRAKYTSKTGQTTGIRQPKCNKSNKDE